MTNPMFVALVEHYGTGVVQPASKDGRVIYGTEADMRAAKPCTGSLLLAPLADRLLP